MRYKCLFSDYICYAEAATEAEAKEKFMEIIRQQPADRVTVWEDPADDVPPVGKSPP